MHRFAALIAGYGVHGTTLALSFRESDLLLPEQLLIVDRYAEPLSVIQERFRDCRTHMLRSGMSDSVCASPQALQQFADQSQRAVSDCDATWHRPTAQIFVDHARSVARSQGLAASLLRGLVTTLARERGTTSSGVYHTQRLYLAMGMDAPDAPEWASRYRGHDARISHVFDRDYELEHLPDGQQCAVVGGGITSVQVARSLVETRGRRVLYVTRRPLDEPRSGNKSDDWV